MKYNQKGPACRQAGQSLIEVLAVLSIAVTIVSAMSISVITSLSTAQFSKNKTLTTQYAQQGMETMRHFKVSNYGRFNSLSGSYCMDKNCGFDSADITACLLPKGAHGCGLNIDAYSREIVIEKASMYCVAPSTPPVPTGTTSSTPTKVTLNVYWNDGKCPVGTLCEKTQFITCVGDNGFTPIAPDTIIIATIVPTQASGGSGGGGGAPPTPVPTTVITATPAPSPIPTIVPTATPIPPTPTLAPPTARSIAIRYLHACAVITDGRVKCWGWNGYGQLGDGTSNSNSIPVTVSGITNAVQVDVGNEHSCALLNDGTVKCWGNNGAGQLGNGTFNLSNMPVQVKDSTGANLSGVRTISSGSFHNCAVLTNNTAKCWGTNGQGEIGDGTTQQRTTATTVSTLANYVLSIGIGDSHSCAVLGGGTVKCWGVGGSGQLGNGNVTNSSVPVAANVSNVQSVGGGDHNTYVVLADSGHTVQSWGENDTGELGIGTTSGGSLNPVGVINQGSTVIDGGVSFACVVRTDASAFCWGGNTYGQLGDGTASVRTTPAAVVGFTNVTSYLSAGTSNTCAIKTDGSAWCWGDGTYGQLGNGTILGSTTPVRVSGF